MMAEANIADRTSLAASLASACSGCHSGSSAGIVSLDGYAEDALQQGFLRYKSEDEGTTVMHRIARGYSDEEIAMISAYIAGESEQR